MSSGVRLGIDFGTSHTVAVWSRHDGPIAPLLFDGSPLLPSGVFGGEDGAPELSTGRDAVNAARLDPGRFEPNPKRRIDDGSVLLGGNEYPVTAVIAAVLSRVRAEAERVAGGPAAEVSLTHPAAWGPRRLVVLTDAAAEAGFADVALVPEPVAAARYFTAVVGHEVQVGHGVVVFDLGGGTFDASVVVRTDSGWEVSAVDGLDDLGGIDVDAALADHVGRLAPGDPAWTRLMSPRSSDERRGRRLLFEDVRMAKETLSRRTRAEFQIPSLNHVAHVTRDELETITRPLLVRAIDVTNAVIRMSRLPRERISGVFPVGGASRMPLATTLLHRAVDMSPTAIEQPELVVAQGATITHRPLPTELAAPVPEHRQGASGDTSAPHAQPSTPVPATPAGTTAPLVDGGVGATRPRRLRRAAVVAAVVVIAVAAATVFGLTSFGSGNETASDFGVFWSKTQQDFAASWEDEDPTCTRTVAHAATPRGKAVQCEVATDTVGKPDVTVTFAQLDDKSAFDERLEWYTGGERETVSRKKVPDGEYLIYSDGDSHRQMAYWNPKYKNNIADIDIPDTCADSDTGCVDTDEVTSYLALYSRHRPRLMSRRTTTRVNERFGEALV